MLNQVMVTIKPRRVENREKGKRFKYCEGAVPSTSKLSGVKKTLLVGVLPFTQENYSNGGTSSQLTLLTSRWTSTSLVETTELVATTASLGTAAPPGPGHPATSSLWVRPRCGTGGSWSPGARVPASTTRTCQN